jgi:DTW domain-containing protein YfiP
MNSDGILSDDRQPLLLYPSEDALELTPEFVRSFSKPFTLIVPDGSWKQARKVARREGFLRDVPHIKIRPRSPSRYRLRQEPNEQSLCTFEAIMMALGVLEGERGAEVEAGMNKLFTQMVERTLWSRGVLPADRCTYPIPWEAIQVSHIAGARGGSRPRGNALELNVSSPIISAPLQPEGI